MNELLNKLREYFAHYLILSIILLIGLAAFWNFRFVGSFQLMVVGLTGLAFLVWGIIHHSLMGDLHLRVFFEYLFTTVFGFLVMWFLLLRA